MTDREVPNLDSMLTPEEEIPYFQDPAVPPKEESQPPAADPIIKSATTNSTKTSEKDKSTQESTSKFVPDKGSLTYDMVRPGATGASDEGSVKYKRAQSSMPIANEPSEASFPLQPDVISAPAPKEEPGPPRIKSQQEETQHDRQSATGQARETREHLFNIAFWISREDHIQKNSAAVLAMDLGVFSYFHSKAKHFALEKQAFTIMWEWIKEMKFNISQDQSTIDEILINVFLKRRFYQTIGEAFVQGREAIIANIRSEPQYDYYKFKKPTNAIEVRGTGVKFRIELNKHVEEYQKRYPQTQRRIDGSEMPPINGLLSVSLGIGKTYLNGVGSGTCFFIELPGKQFVLVTCCHNILSKEMGRAYKYKTTTESKVLEAIKENFSNLKIRVPNQSFAFDSARREYSLDQICSKWPDPLFHAVKVADMIGIKVKDPKEFGSNVNPMPVNPERYNEKNGPLVAFGSYIMIVQCPDTYVRHSQGTVVECEGIRRIGYDCSTESGSSGAPILYNSEQDCIVVGVHTKYDNPLNYGSLLTKSFLDKLMDLNKL